MNIVDNYSSDDEQLKLDFDEIEQYVMYLKKKTNEKKNLTLVFVNNDYIKDLNNEFRQKDYATDVLTFCEDNEVYLGDVIISIDKMKEAAQEYNHSEKRELFFLITHGFLHLKGYDHQTEDEEKEMFELQNQLLNDYGIKRG